MVFAFSLGVELVMSIRAGKMVSLQNTRYRENILQAQSESTYKVSITILVEVLYTMTLENDISRLEKCNAVSDGHVLQLYLSDRYCIVTKAFNMPSFGFRKCVP